MIEMFHKSESGGKERGLLGKNGNYLDGCYGIEELSTIQSMEKIFKA